ncbi:MAG: S8 family serine peptidase [Desulfobulbaceae bacterium]|nr:S8 family serine peptidase [Desulfobulbaceae bacterium]
MVLKFTRYLSLLLLLAASSVLVAGADVCAQGGKGTPPTLSARVVNQIKLLGEEKRSRTAAQRKMSSQLVHTIKLRRGDPALRQLPSLDPMVRVAVDDTVLVDIKADVSPQLLGEIAWLGGEVISSHAEYGAIRARLPLEAMESLAEGGDVHSIRQASRPFLRKADTSEGDIAHGADTARKKYSLTGKNIKTGQGIKVGVLSDSVDYLSYVQSLGDLPGVTVLQNAPGNSGEGTAMLEIIHDLAPDARLYFATAWNGKASFASNIKALANAGCDVIVDDVGYLDESPFQDDIISRAVNTVTSQGVLYFSAAGNGGNLNDGTSGVWEGDYRPYSIVIDGQLAEVHDFGGGDWTNRITRDAGCYTLFWSDPLGASNNDYDLYLLDPTGTTVVGESSAYQDGFQDPLEGFCLADGEDVTNYHLVVARFNGQNRFLHLSANSGRLVHVTDGQIWGHPAAVDAFAVAAVNAQNRTSPFAGTENVEPYTSDGPRRVFYYPDGTPINLDFSSTGGALRLKPDIAAADCVRTATPGFSRFCGTSAAASHAAAIAALMLSGKPDLTVAQARQAFINSSFDIEAPGWDRDSGHGLVMAERVMDLMFGIINPGIRFLLLRK